jgi:hypothetical protein
VVPARGERLVRRPIVPKAVGLRRREARPHRLADGRIAQIALDREHVVQLVASHHEFHPRRRAPQLREVRHLALAPGRLGPAERVGARDHDARDLGAEAARELGLGHALVFDDVVQQRGDRLRLVTAEFGDERRDREQVRHVRRPRTFANLGPMFVNGEEQGRVERRRGCERHGAPEHSARAVRRATRGARAGHSPDDARAGRSPGDARAGRSTGRRAGGSFHRATRGRVVPPGDARAGRSPDRSAEAFAARRERRARRHFRKHIPLH